MFFKLISNIYSNNVKVKVILMFNNEKMLEMDFSVLISLFSGKLKFKS